MSPCRPLRCPVRDLLVATPSRGRPGRLQVMLDAALSLSQAQTDIAVAWDDDDPQQVAYQRLSARMLGEDDCRTLWFTGPRSTVTGWTNGMALGHAGDYRAVASLSDDHVPRTPGWDRLLLEAIDGMGGTGIAYGNDLHQESRTATSWVMSADIVQALGWLALPACSHYHIDDAVVALGREAGCLAYLPEVVIEHCHPGWGTGTWDDVYASEAARGPADEAAFSDWYYDGQMAADVAVVSALREARRCGS